MQTLAHTRLNVLLTVQELFKAHAHDLIDSLWTHSCNEITIEKQITKHGITTLNSITKSNCLAQY